MPGQETVADHQAWPRAFATSRVAHESAAWDVAAARAPGGLPASRVHTLGVQVPIAGLAAKNGTIGVWASVDRRKVTTRGATTRDAGAWVQVNRLGKTHEWEFNEWVHGKTGLAMGKAYQAWSAAAYLRACQELHLGAEEAQNE